MMTEKVMLIYDEQGRQYEEQMPCRKRKQKNEWKFIQFNFYWYSEIQITYD